MKFYNRKEEISSFENIAKNSQQVGAQLTVLLGRRRVGKSELIHQTFKGKKYLYFFVSPKKSANLLEEFGAILNKQKGDNRAYQTWDEFLEKLFSWAKETKTTLVFDEFQDFFKNDKTVYSIFQKTWDKFQHQKNLNIIVAGSVVSLLEKIFYNQKEPLFNRATNKIYLEEFDFNSVGEVLKDNRPKKGDLLELLHFYTVFGGGPFYYNQIYKSKIFKESLDQIIEKLLLEKSAPLQREGRELLILEFGGEHTTYFTILESIALNFATFTKIQHHTKIDQGLLVRSLARLADNFYLIKKQKPVFPNNQKTSRYTINNNFINFWFRYVYPNQSLIEAGFTGAIRKKIKSELNSLAGLTFENFCLNQVMQFSEKEKLDFLADYFGQWWDKNGQVDLVVASKKEKMVILGECKLSAKEISLTTLEKLKDTSRRINALEDYNKKFILFCAQKVPAQAKSQLKKAGAEVWDF